MCTRLALTVRWRPRPVPRPGAQDYLETKRIAFPRFYFVAPAGGWRLGPRCCLLPTRPACARLAAGVQPQLPRRADERFCTEHSASAACLPLVHTRLAPPEPPLPPPLVSQTCWTSCPRAPTRSSSSATCPRTSTTCTTSPSARTTRCAGPPPAAWRNDGGHLGAKAGPAAPCTSGRVEGPQACCAAPEPHFPATASLLHWAGSAALQQRPGPASAALPAPLSTHLARPTPTRRASPPRPPPACTAARPSTSSSTATACARGRWSCGCRTWSTP
jgi:hypothetical protein